MFFILALGVLVGNTWFVTGCESPLRAQVGDIPKECEKTMKGVILMLGDLVQYLVCCYHFVCFLF